MPIRSSDIGRYDVEDDERGMNRYLTPEYKQAGKAKTKAAQARRRRIRDSVENGTARYDLAGQPVDPQDAEAFAKAKPRNKPQHTVDRHRGHGMGAYLDGTE